MISVNEARKIMGKRSQKFSDNNLEQIIKYLYFICEKIVDSLNKKHEY